MWMDQIARGWLLYELTNSTVQLGFVTALRAVPLLLLSPVAGALADRYDRKTQLSVALAIDGSSHVLMAALIFSGLIEPWHVYATGAVTSVASVFEQPARQAMVANVVDRRRLTNAIGLDSMVFNVSRSTGPALAGALIALAGTGAADTVSMVLRQTIRQLVTPDALRGRMVSVNMVFFMGGPQLGEMEAGLVARAFGAPVSVIAGGIAALVATALIAWRASKLRHYRD
jgi:MFS family permease